jgi:hypothetical protein
VSIVALGRVMRQDADQIGAMCERTRPNDKTLTREERA